MITLYLVDFILIIGSLLGLTYIVFQFLAILSSAPYVRSDDKAIADMIALANLKPGMHVLELGSGNGEISLRAAEHGAIAHGIEINAILVWWSRWRTHRRKLQERVSFERKSFWKTTLPADTEVVFMYLMPASMPRLWDKMAHELRPGTAIISNAFNIPSSEPIEKRGKILKYIIPVA